MMSRFGLGLGGVTRSEGVGGAIAALFADGRRGFAFTPWDLTTLFQDSAGTTPVTADGDPVGLMRDVSGRGNHATSSGTKRPLWKASGGLCWLQPDGIDDCMQIASLALSTTQHEWLAYDQTDNASPLLFEHSASAGANPGHFMYGSSPPWQVYRTTLNNAAGAANWASGKHVNERTYVGGSSGTFAVDGVTQANGTITGVSQAESVVTTAYNLFSRNQGSLFSKGRYYGHVLCDGSANSNAPVYDLLRTKAGL